MAENQKGPAVRSDRLPYVDALRGYAILMVIAVHAAQLIPTLPWAARQLADQGARGVQLFFVASALTLMQSWHRRNDGAWPFYVRRIFRIAPMFWLATIFFAGLAWWRTADLPWAKAIAALAFVHGLRPDTINGVVPGGWTIADEMMFYAVFPLLAAWITNWRIALGALVAGGFLATVLRIVVFHAFADSAPPDQRGLISDFTILWFPFQLPAFLTGILVYQAMNRLRGQVSRGVARAGVLGATVAAIALTFFSPLALLQHAFALVFGVFAFCLAEADLVALVNPAIAAIGKVSYSAYLWHLALIYLFADHMLAWHLDGLAGFAVMLVALAASTMVAATVTWRLIEAPMIRFGGVLAGKLARASARIEQRHVVERAAADAAS